MDASVDEPVLEQSKLSNSSLGQKRELVYEIANWSEGAVEILQAWSRQEILQVLCAELGKERKYTGLTKVKIIEHLLKVVSDKKSKDDGSHHSLESNERTAKRQKKSDNNPNQLPLGANNSTTASSHDVDSTWTTYCKNSACKAKLNHYDVFCKRCSCCICRQYDDNKDPSLWLLCSADPPFEGNSCGLSCHLECALKHEKTGIMMKDKGDKGVDGIFYCVSCGKVNDLVSSWRKQVIAARDTRRVDILCYRLSLSQKILAATRKYQDPYGIVDKAVKKLEEDVGPLTGLPVKMARGIVNRLSSGPEVQKLCAFALDSLDSMLSSTVPNTPHDREILSSKLVTFEDASATSVTIVLNYDDSTLQNVVGYTLWHRKASDTDYPAEPTYRLFAPNRSFLLSGLSPSTLYLLKVVPFNSSTDMEIFEVHFQTDDISRTENPKSSEVERSQSPATMCSSLSNPSSVEDETNNPVPCHNNNGDDYLGFRRTPDKTSSANLLIDAASLLEQSEKETSRDVILLDEEHSMDKNVPDQNDGGLNLNEKGVSDDGMTGEETSTDNGSNSPHRTGLECVPYIDSSEAGLPETPCKLEKVKDGVGRSNRPIPPRNESARDQEEPQAGSSSGKRSAERREEGSGDKDLEYYVKVMRWLECEGHIETEFRTKFLTWYGLRATKEHLRIVKVFVDTFIEDPASLAGQLVDTFSDVISDKRSSKLPPGFCFKLFH